MPGLNKAIAEQIVRMTSDEPLIAVRPPSESDNLLTAITALLEAYRQRLDGSGEDIPRGFVKDSETGRLRAKVSDTFATEG